jgi:hypothetical protein
MLIKAGSPIRIDTVIPANGTTAIRGWTFESAFKIKDISGTIDNGTFDDLLVVAFKVNGRNILPIPCTLKFVKTLAPKLSAIAKGSVADIFLKNTSKLMLTLDIVITAV